MRTFTSSSGSAADNRWSWGMPVHGALLEQIIQNKWFVVIVPVPRRSSQLFTGFVQDEVTLVPYKLRLTLGTKLEENEHTGAEIQPLVNLLWILS